MTVHGFSKVFKPTVERARYRDFAGQTLAIDASIEVIRAATVKIGAHLTNAKGEPTQHILITFNNALQMFDLGIEPIWCFDGKAPELKADTIQDRKELAAKRDAKVNALQEEYDGILDVEKSTPREKLLEIDPTFFTTKATKELELQDARRSNLGGEEFGKFKRDVYHIIDSFGMQRVVAPDKVDAEHLAAWMCEHRGAKGVITSDPDALLHGAPRILKKRRKDAGRYDVYEREQVLKQHDIDQEELIKVSVALGTDFAPKVKGVGPARVVKMVKGDAIEWSDDQKEAIEHFGKDFQARDVKIEQKAFQRTNLVKLRNWLIDEQNFNAARLDKQLQPVFDRVDGVEPVKKVRARKTAGSSSSTIVNTDSDPVDDITAGTGKVRIRSKKA